MQEPHTSRRQTDPRIVLYRITLRAAGLIVVVLLVKLLALDIILVKGDSMLPSIKPGDRVLVLRTPFLPLLREAGLPGRDRPVIFSQPFENKRGCLRIAGVSGDAVSVDSGVFRNGGAEKTAPARGKPPEEPLLPPDFSPRDFLPGMRIPAPGDTLTLDTPDLYRLFTAIAVIRQENMSAAFSLKPRVMIDSAADNDYFISGFSLYKGRLDSVPEPARYDWFFWNRLRDYLRQTHTGHSVNLLFTFSQDGRPVERYRVRNKYVFLLADNWKTGLDSRYFGPVSHKRLFGRPIAVLWSFSGSDDGGSGFNFKRLGRVLR